MDPSESTIPTDYYGISFSDWLDIFLEYALVASGQGAATEAYETLAAAADASVWYHSKADTAQIHVCWFSMYMPTVTNLFPLVFLFANITLSHIFSMRSTSSRRGHSCQ
jgi:hypothetical protein